MNGSLGPLYISHGLMVSSILVSCIATGMLDVWMFVCFLAVQFLDTIYTILYLKIFKWKKCFFCLFVFFCKQLFSFHGLYWWSYKRDRQCLAKRADFILEELKWKHQEWHWEKKFAIMAQCLVRMHGLDTKHVAEHTLGLWLPLGSRTVIGVVQSFWQARQESAQSSRVGICVSE